jgi:PAS domain S-box-containing protein
LDITERKQAEEKVRQSEERLQLILESALDAIITIDTKGRVVDWNPQAEVIFGWTHAEAIGQKMADLIIPEDSRTEHEKGLQRHITTGEGSLLGKRIEIDGVNRDGDIFPLELTISPIPTAAGLTFTGFLRNISERRQAEETLRESEAQLNIAQHIAKTGSWIWDPSGTLTWSKNMFALFGMPDNAPPTFEGFLARVVEEDRGRVMNGFQDFLASSRTRDEVEYRIIDDDGETKVIQAVGFTERDKNGTPIKVVGTVQDITDRKRAENELRASEERYRTTLDNMLAGCQVIGFDWRYLYVNDEVAKQGRQTKDDLLGHTMMQVYPGIENTDMFAVLQISMNERSTHRMENEFIYLDGGPGWFDLSIQPVPEGIFIVSLDITERKRAERLQEAIYQIAQAMVTTDSLAELFPQIHKILEGSQVSDQRRAGCASWSLAGRASGW